jgi:ABC-2 type transport system ATP-binding protein
MDIVRADSGKGAPVRRTSNREQLNRLAYLPEERGLYTKQKVIDVMVYFGSSRGSAPRGQGPCAHLARAHRRVDGRISVERLSKGMSQKVQIASTLLSEPELCVLDEPFSGLDPVNTALVRDLISEIRASGRTTILSTHQMSMVETLCDRVALLSEGKLMVYGEVNEVRRYSAWSSGSASGASCGRPWKCGRRTPGTYRLI